MACEANPTSHTLCSPLHFVSDLRFHTDYGHLTATTDWLTTDYKVGLFVKELKAIVAFNYFRIISQEVRRPKPLELKKFLLLFSLKYPNLISERTKAVSYPLFLTTLLICKSG